MFGSSSTKYVIMFAVIILIVSVAVFGFMYVLNYFEVEKNYNRIVRESYDTQKSLDEYIPMRLCEIADVIVGRKSQKKFI